MKKCTICGNYFDPDEAEEMFNDEYGPTLSYGQFRHPVCGDCARDVIENKLDGYYFATCEDCGCEFDLILEESKFDQNHSWYNGTSLIDYWDDDCPRCSDCAMEEEERRENEE